MKPILVCLAVGLLGIALGVLNAILSANVDSTGALQEVALLAPLGYMLMIIGITGTVFLSMRAVVHKI